MFNPIVDPEFKDLLPKHSPSELAALEKAVLADPEHRNCPPVYLWHQPEGDIIVDGNTQFVLRKKHGLHIRYEVMDFPDRAAALLYTLDAQISRRNLDKSQLAILVLDPPRHTEGRPEQNSANLQSYSIEELAAKVGVSPRSVATAAKVKGQAAPGVIDGVKDGKFKVSDAEKILKLPAAMQEKLVEQATAKGTTLANAAKPSAGTTFDPAELELASAVAAFKKPTNGKPVVDGRVIERTLRNLSELCRQMWALGLREKYSESVSEMIRDVRTIGGLKPLPVAGTGAGL